MAATRKEKIDFARDLLKENANITNAEIDAALLKVCGERLHPEFTAKLRRELGIYKRGMALHTKVTQLPLVPTEPAEPARIVTVEVSRKAFAAQVKALQATMKAQDIASIVITPEGVKIGRITWDTL